MLLPLQRSFAATDELIFRAAVKDPASKKCYQALAAMHEVRPSSSHGQQLGHAVTSHSGCLPICALHVPCLCHICAIRVPYLHLVALAPSSQSQMLASVPSSTDEHPVCRASLAYAPLPMVCLPLILRCSVHSSRMCSRRAAAQIAAATFNSRSVRPPIEDRICPLCTPPCTPTCYSPRV